MLLVESIEEGTGFVGQGTKRRDEAPPIVRQPGATAALASDLPVDQRKAEVLLGSVDHLPGLAVGHPHLGGGAAERSGRIDADEELADPGTEDRLAAVLQPDSPAETDPDGVNRGQREIGGSGRQVLIL